MSLFPSCAVPLNGVWRHFFAEVPIPFLTIRKWKKKHDSFPDIDECASPSDNWCETASDDHVTCENQNRGYRCVCSEGYELKPNGIACQGNIVLGYFTLTKKFY